MKSPKDSKSTLIKRRTMRQPQLQRAIASRSVVPDTKIDLHANSPWDKRRQVVKSRARREMNTQAKELFRDADATQKLFTKFKKDILALRVHNAVRILLTEFFSDSISSSGSPVLAESSYLGALEVNMHTTRQDKFQDLITQPIPGQYLPAELRKARYRAIRLELDWFYLRPLAVALIGVDQLLPLWTHPTGSDFVRGSKLVAKPLVAEQRKLRTQEQELVGRQLNVPITATTTHRGLNFFRPTPSWLPPDHTPWPQTCQATYVLCEHAACNSPLTRFALC